MRKVMTFAEENTKKGQGVTCDQVIQRLEALPGTSDDLEGTYGFVKETSSKIYNHLVKNCSDEAFGIVRSVESGDGVEAWVNVTSTSGWMRSTRRRGATFVRCTVTWWRKGSDEGRNQKEAEKEDPKEEAVREMEKGTERAKEW